MLTGSCLCGAVAFQISKTPTRTVACHCGQCRRQSGHLWAATPVPSADLKFSETGGLAWYAASDFAKRGFCKTCGSSLFWKHNDEDEYSVSLGSLHEPTGIRLQEHIFANHKGDYYDIADGLPQSDA